MRAAALPRTACAASVCSDASTWPRSCERVPAYAETATAITAIATATPAATPMRDAQAHSPASGSRSAYPTPRIVWICGGAPASSSLRRR